MSAKETFSAGQTREFFGAGDFFRLLQTTGPITVEFYLDGREVAEMVDIEAGYAESFAREQKRFDRIRIYSPTAQDVKWVTRDGSDVRYDRGAASITGSVDLNAATIAQLRSPRPEAQTGSTNVSGALAATTAEVVVTPGTNVNGVIVYSATFSDYGTAPIQGGLLAKEGAPTAITDGVMIAHIMSGGPSSSNTHHKADLQRDVFIPAGLGIYWYASITTSSNCQRTTRFRVL